jgi:hypothetical protein
VYFLLAKKLFHFVGEIMFDRYVRQVSDKYGYKFPFQKFVLLPIWLDYFTEYVSSIWGTCHSVISKSS